MDGVDGGAGGVSSEEWDAEIEMWPLGGEKQEGGVKTWRQGGRREKSD